jgi:hypothetical protein
MLLTSFPAETDREAVSSHEDQGIKMCAVKAEQSTVSRREALTEGAHFYDTLEKLETASRE